MKDEKKHKKSIKQKGFTTKEMEKIRKNECVQSVTAARITYKEEFKRQFVQLYEAGKKPAEIFRSFGFDTIMLGNKRIERASHRWRQEYGTKE